MGELMYIYKCEVRYDRAGNSDFYKDINVRAGNIMKAITKAMEYKEYGIIVTDVIKVLDRVLIDVD